VVLALSTQVEAIVFDGVRPSYRDLRAPKAAILPWLINFISIAGVAVDMSGTVSGSPSVGWTAKWIVSSATATVLSVPGAVLSSTATAGGSSVGWPNAAGGQAQVLLSVTDAAALSGFLEHALYLTDQFGNTYKAVYGMLYPQQDSG
jgi:hypothetical protein